MTGWGKTNNNQKDSKRVFQKELKQVRLPIANSLCTKLSNEIDESTQICAGGKRRKYMHEIQYC